MSAPRERLVVVGNGMAGARFVEDLLARGGSERFDVTVFGDEATGNYNRILLSGVLAGTHDAADIFLNPLSWYDENGVRLRAGVRARRIDREARVVFGDGDVEEPYDRLVLATGSTPFVPPIEGLVGTDGSLLPGVFVFRTLQDCDRIAAWARGCRRAVVVGGGLLGLEAARGLLNLGPEVHVVHLMPHLMEVQLDEAAGTILGLTLARMGVSLHLPRTTRRVEGAGAVSGVVFDDGSRLECDMLVVAAGIRPNVELAREAGLSVERGIVVGDDLATPDDPDVFALGECAQHRGRVYGLVAPLWDQAAVLADRLSGRRPDAVYEGSEVSTKLKVMGVELAVMGRKDADGEIDEVVTYSEPARGVYKKLVIRDGRLAGAILLGDGSSAPALQQAFDRGFDLPEARSELLFPGAGGGLPRSAIDLPDDAQLCQCNGVSKGRVAAAVSEGCSSVEAVARATRAGTGCGSCKGLIGQLIKAVSDEGMERIRASEGETAA